MPTATAARSPVELIHELIEAHQAATEAGGGYESGAGYLGYTAAERLWDSATPSERKAATQWVLAFHRESDWQSTHPDCPVLFAGCCAGGLELECKPVRPVETPPVDFHLIRFDCGKGFVAVPNKIKGKGKGGIKASV